MKGSDIEKGQTYLFLSTESPARQNLIGTRFTVVEIRRVWRRKNRRRVQTMRYFNDDGVGARADELAELSDAITWGIDVNEKPAETVKAFAHKCPRCDGSPVPMVCSTCGGTGILYETEPF